MPRLQFGPETGISSRIIISILTFLSIAWGTSAHFLNHRILISSAVAGVILLQLLANLIIQFNWAEPDPLLRGLASMFILPTGALWACLLSANGYGEEVQQVPTSFLSAFSKPLVLIPFILVLGIGYFLVSYRLGYYDFWEDERMVINAAIGLCDEGLSYLEEGYELAWFHSWLVSQSIQLFGESEWSSRVPSAIFGLVFILTSYYVFYKFFSLPWLGILIPLACLLTDEFLILFRYPRIYALLIPVFLRGI